jgi:glycosyltransferase involved in cell wall biosynthesis
MPPITAALITFNEERDLPQALASLAGVADEFVIVDSGSTDRTGDIAREFGARFIHRNFTDFAEQKNFASDQAAHNWVLVLDADEVLSPELRASLLEWKQSEPDCVAYRVSRKTNYLGAWILHSGWYPDYIIRLQRRDRTRYVGSIHEVVRADGPVGQLHGDLLHYTVRSRAEYEAKVEVFTTLAAEDLYRRGRRHWRAALCVVPAWTLLRNFILRRGFLDGRLGARIAWNGARYVWIKYRKLGLLVRGGRLQHREWPQAGNA